MKESLVLTENDIEFISLIMKGYTSSYSIWTYIKKNTSKKVRAISYKNVNKRIIRLYDAGYLEELERSDQENIHGRKDYKLTIEGVKQLLPHITLDTYGGGGYFGRAFPFSDLLSYMENFNLDKKPLAELFINEIISRTRNFDELLVRALVTDDYDLISDLADKFSRVKMLNQNIEEKLAFMQKALDSEKPETHHQRGKSQTVEKPLRMESTEVSKETPPSRKKKTT